MNRFFRSGEPFIWLTGSALALCLFMISGLVGVILYHGLGAFWPKDMVEYRTTDGRKVMGRVVGREEIPAGLSSSDGGYRIQLKTGNRDTYGLDFRWMNESDIAGRTKPEDAVVLERLEWGDFYGFVGGLYNDGVEEAIEGPLWEILNEHLRGMRLLTARIHGLEKDDLGEVNNAIEQLRLQKRRLELDVAPREEIEAVDRQYEKYWDQYEQLAAELMRLREESERIEVAVRLSSGEERRIKVAHIVRAYRPNQLNTIEKVLVYLSKAWEFFAGEPRESNTEGGVFPAIFGTVMMVMLMTVAVVPFGVLAALYLREYAKQGLLVQSIRIAVNNLAGVPSIVFGMFGLGFFVYGVGGGIDRLFYAEALPAPTFGTGGILWASLTLALLTVPVVVVATEEALASVPREIRDGSLALGSTKLQMIWRVVLPSALPGILTGVILATARGAGEVAPLMITGVVKLAPDLPVDSFWPFLHLERKFMHLGFHIYDVGFQSPNVEAARPMVYTTALLLLGIVLALNLTAIVVRNYLRKRYASSAF